MAAPLLVTVDRRRITRKNLGGGRETVLLVVVVGTKLSSPCETAGLVLGVSTAG